MSPSAPPTCTHDRGRGTTVCLRCRHEHAQASQRKRQRFFMQFLGLASIAGILIVAGVGAASTLRSQAEVTTSEGNVTVPDAKPAPRKVPAQAVPTPAPV